jgi:hypothetical protein
MRFDDAFDERETDAGAFRARVQLIEQAENLSMELWLDSHAIILYEENGLFAFSDADFNARIGLTSHILCGIIDEIFEDLTQALAISVDGR